MNIFDTSVPNEEDALVQIINHRSPVHHANFLSETEIFALSNDEGLSLFKRAVLSEGAPEGEEDDDEGPPSLAFGDIRPLLECEYVVDVLPAGNSGLVCAGSHRQVFFPDS